MALKADLALLTSHFEGCAVFQGFRLEEDTVSFRVTAGGASGVVSLSLHDRSCYPQTGALVFAEGSDALNTIVERCSEAISERAALPAVIRMLGAALEAAPADLPGVLAGLPETSGAKPTRQPSGDDDEDGDEDDDDAGSDDDDEQTNMDYDFEKGAELENKLLRLRHEWEVKDQRRRKALESEEEETTTAEAPPPQPQHRRKAPADTKKNQQKRGAHQIFSAAEATRMLCNELFDLMKEHAEGFYGVAADCVDHDIHLWRVQIRRASPSPPPALACAALHPSRRCLPVCTGTSTKSPRCMRTCRCLSLLARTHDLFAPHPVPTSNHHARSLPPSHPQLCPTQPRSLVSAGAEQALWLRQPRVGA